MLKAYTLNLDDSLMLAAKSKAVQDRTSVSEMVRRLPEVSSPRTCL